MTIIVAIEIPVHVHVHVYVCVPAVVLVALVTVTVALKELALLQELANDLEWKFTAEFLDIWSASQVQMC